MLVERSALVFRGLHLTDAERITLAGRIVDFGGEGISPISMDPTVSRVADHTRGVFYWHIDGADDSVPAKATMHGEEPVTADRPMAAIAA